MAPPPAKRQKNHVVLSSDDDEDKASVHVESKVCKLVTRITSNKNGPATQPLPTRSRAKPIESIVNKHRQTAVTQTTRKFPDVSERKTTRKSKPSIKSQASKPATTLFGAASQPQLLDRQITRTAILPEAENETEDYIEDGSSIEEGIGRLRTNHSSDLVLDRRKRSWEDEAPSGSQRFKLAATKKDADEPVARREAHPPPWAERFGPNDLEELMVHKKKVSDVQNWLDNVLQGRDRKRILILRGPSGAGKTATISILAKVMGLELCEWRNPVGKEFSSEGYLSMATQFEDFLGRSGRFGGLELSDNAGRSGDPAIPATAGQSTRRKVILLEEFPNTSLSTSSALRSFRSNILEYLAVDFPSSGTRVHVTPLVMVVTETRLTTTTAASDSFTVHRLLGSHILSHPGVSIINFNPMAARLLTKALDIVIRKEARQSGRRRIPGPSVLEQLGEVGDLRSAIGSLEFLCLRGDDNDWGGRVASRAKKGPSTSSIITRMERESLELVTQRESSLGIFHAVGKVVYNKRDQVNALQRALLQPPHHLSNHARYGASQISIDRLIDETGTDTVTFIAALHENYVLSCEGTSFIDAINGCLEALSDSDVLGSTQGGRFGSAREYGGRSFQGAASDTLRQDEICFHLAVRGLLFALPNPVKRRAHPVAGKNGGRNDSHRMFYPMSMRLSRQMEDVDSLVDRWVDRLRCGCGLLKQAASNRSHQFASIEQTIAEVHTQQSSQGPDQDPEPIRTSLNCTKAEIILERLPYITKIEKQRTAPMRLNELEQITQFHGFNTPSSEVSDEEEADDLVSIADWITVRPAEVKPVNSAPRQLDAGPAGKEDNIHPSEKVVEKLYLSDDDIED